LKNNRTNLKHLVLATYCFAAVSCAKTDPKKSTAPVASKTEESSTKDVETADFTGKASDGRSVAWATWSNRYDAIDFTKLRSKTVQYYGIPSNTAFTMLNLESDRKILWTFSNFQDSVAVKDVIAGVKLACNREGYSSYLACVDDAIFKSGSVVFEMKVKNGSPTDPNSEGHIRDALYGLMGATFVNVPDHNGVMEERMTASCVTCHSSKQVKVDQNNIARLLINMQGDNSNGDVLAKADYFARFEQMKGYINDPADPIWGISEETKAAGYLAGQYQILKDKHGHVYNLNESRFVTEREKGNMKAAVDAGWVSAFANWITSAKTMCSVGSGMYSDPAGCGVKDNALQDANIAINTAKTTASTMLEARSNILVPWVAEAPLRSQRPTYYVDRTGFGAGSSEKSLNFALDYVKYYGIGNATPMQTALPYLLSATSISMIMPGVVDDALAKKWYGSSATAASADVLVKKYLPRTIIANYAVDALAYHTARYRFPDFLPSNLIQTISFADLTSAHTDYAASCASCHASAVIDLSAASTQLNACRGKASCSLKGTTADDYTSNYLMTTPTSAWATKVLNAMETLPSGMNGPFEYIFINNNVQSAPKRFPLVRRSALGLWSYLDYEQALRPKALRHAPAYALVAPRMNLARTVEAMTVDLTFDFDKNGRIGKESMFCLQSDRFDLNRDGVAETGCFDAIQILSGGTPRPVGKADSLDKVHDLIYTPLSDATRRARLAKLVAALADGGVNIVWENGTKTQLNFYPEATYAEVAAGYSGGYGTGSSGGSYGGGGYGGGY
jgi:hypothetical protein